MKRVALIGYGYWGPNLLRNLFETKDCEVAYCCDLSIDKLYLAKKRYPSVNITTDMELVINDETVDAILIATPTKTHFPIAEKILLAGKDILIEKPMAMNLREAKKLTELAKKKGKIIMVDHTFLFNNAVLKVKDLIADGELGEILYIDSVRTNLGLFQPDVNVVFDLATHDFSIIQFLLESKPISVQATGKSYFNKRESIAYITVSYPKNILAHIHVSWLSPLKIRRMLIIGTKKMVVYDEDKPSEEIRIYDKGVIVEETYLQVEKQAKISYRSGDILLPKVNVVEPLGILIDIFIKAISSREIPRSSGDSALDVMAALEASTNSLKTGRKVKL